ncbi:hypothetical protein STSP1_01136 [Sedimentisphaera salicampi]|uniref:Uncharacterized protein n=1 Tax=Sedimentisphaera salicampi TaxID=1941349 RepID=A0A1W6LLV0_9BACT|nr:hypothetical protein STSP1_01136 [Sedimentisphaera salicampi]
MQARQQELSADGRGVLGEIESEVCLMQSIGLTNRNPESNIKHNLQKRFYPTDIIQEFPRKL